MATITVHNTAGETQAVEIKPNTNLMELLREAGYEEIAALCGGSCSCATCHVHILSAGNVSALPDIEEDEEVLLEMADDYEPEKSRLSCQLELSDVHHGMHVQLLEGEGF